MRYTVFDLITDVKRKVHDATVPQIQSALDEGRRNLIGKVKPPEMERKAYIEQALYPRVDKYACPDDLKYQAIIDIKILHKYRNLDTLWEPLAQVYQREIDQKNRDNIFSINWENGVKLMTINHPRGLKNCNHLEINRVDSLTENGTWNVGGNVVDLRVDELNHITKKASLSFDINSSSSAGFIENFTMNPIDINDYLGKGAIFSWLSLPIPKEMLSVRLSIGSDNANYYYNTVNQPHDNNVFITGWNLLKYMMSDMNSFGNPNPKAITYIRLDFNTTGEAIPNCNINAINIRKGEVYEAKYNSAFCLIDARTGAWKMKTTANSDIFPFEEDSYQLIMLETALVVQKNLYGNNAGAKADVTDIEDELEKKYFQYRKDHKDQFIQPEQATQIMGRQMYGYDDGIAGHHRHRPNGWYEQGLEDNSNC